MSRPTEEQIKALKPGDRFLAECVVVTPFDSGDLTARFSSDDPAMGGGAFKAKKWPCVHSILPREITVGDKVRRIGWGGEPWEVAAGPRPCRARPAEYAIWREGDGFESVPADHLEIIS